MLDEPSKTAPVKAARWSGRFGPLVRFAGWWAGMFAVLGSSAVCPCCGQAACPGSVASAGVLGGLFAVLMAVPRWVRRRFAR